MKSETFVVFWLNFVWKLDFLRKMKKVCDKNQFFSKKTCHIMTDTINRSIEYYYAAYSRSSQKLV